MLRGIKVVPFVVTEFGIKFLVEDNLLAETILFSVFGNESNCFIFSKLGNVNIKLS